MRYFFKNFLLFFTLPLITYVPFNIFLLPILMEKMIGPSVETQISLQFKNALERDYDLLILGNSRLYQGLNPDKFNFNSFNFAHDNDSYNQIFHKLIFLNNKKKKFDYIILGIDYFQFGVFSDNRNYMYASLLGVDYLADYKFKYPKLVYYKNLLRPNRLIRLKNNNELAYIKSNGQFIKDGKAKKDNSVLRNAYKNEIQVNYFNKIIEFCAQKDIKIFLVMPPVREIELSAYPKGEIEKFNDFLAVYLLGDIIYFDFSTDKTFDYTDYTDITHLNKYAADKFSQKLNDSIQYYLVKENLKTKNLR